MLHFFALDNKSVPQQSPRKNLRQKNINKHDELECHRELKSKVTTFDF